MRVIKAIAIITLILGIGLYLIEDFLIYPTSTPHQNLEDNRIGYQNPMQRDIPYENIEMDIQDNMKIYGWLMIQSQAAPTILFFHANAGNRGMRLDFIEQFYRGMGLNVFIIDYRGYGESDGKPSEEGLKYDAEIAIQYLFDRKLNEIYVFGRSLGGAVSIYIANKYPQVKGLILENTFKSIPHVVESLCGKVSALLKPLIKNTWNSIEEIKTVKCPILFISGRSDTLIHPSHMDSLYENAQEAKFRIIKNVPEGDHNTTWRMVYSQYPEWVLSFINDSRNY